MTSANRKLLATREKDEDTVVVLYDLQGTDYSQPYVTWCARKDAPEATFWGHYFDNVVDAVHDFDKR